MVGLGVPDKFVGGDKGGVGGVEGLSVLLRTFLTFAPESLKLKVELKLQINKYHEGHSQN